jgi:hypothetical protein
MKKEDLTPEQINLYWDSYFAVVDTLIAAQGKLQQLEDDATDLGERSGYRADRLRIEADIELMRAKRVAFNAGSSIIKEPDQGTVDSVVALGKEVADKTAQSAEAAAIVHIATQAINEFNKVQ